MFFGIRILHLWPRTNAQIYYVSAATTEFLHIWLFEWANDCLHIILFYFFTCSLREND